MYDKKKGAEVLLNLH